MLKFITIIIIIIIIITIFVSSPKATRLYLKKLRVYTSKTWIE